MGKGPLEASAKLVRDRTTAHLPVCQFFANWREQRHMKIISQIDGKPTFAKMMAAFCWFGQLYFEWLLDSKCSRTHEVHAATTGLIIVITVEPACHNKSLIRLGIRSVAKDLCIWEEYSWWQIGRQQLKRPFVKIHEMSANFTDFLDLNWIFGKGLQWKKTLAKEVTFTDLHFSLPPVDKASTILLCKLHLGEHIG